MGHLDVNFCCFQKYKLVRPLDERDCDASKLWSSRIYLGDTEEGTQAMLASTVMPVVDVKLLEVQRLRVVEVIHRILNSEIVVSLINCPDKSAGCGTCAMWRQACQSVECPEAFLVWYWT